jgi:hypothetical protein
MLAYNDLALMETQILETNRANTISIHGHFRRMSDITIVSFYHSYQMMQTSTWSNEIMNAEILPAFMRRCDAS